MSGRAVVACAAALALLAAACSSATTTTAAAPDTTLATTTTPPATTTSRPPPDTTAAPDTTLATSTTTTLPEPEALVAALPTGPCDGLGPPPGLLEAEIAFTAGGRIYAADPNGQGVRCVLEAGAPEGAALLWGPAGDRLAAYGALVREEGQAVAVPAGAGPVEWTRPTGGSVIYVADGGARLEKLAVETGVTTDVSFLEQHEEVVYYPSGTHIGVVGTHASGEYGIWLATNLGEEAQRLVRPGEGVEVSQPRFNQVGQLLYFVADHGDATHLHELFILGEEIVSATEDEAGVLLSSSTVFADLTVSPLDEFTLAVREGECADPAGTTTRVVVFGEEIELPEELAAVDTAPIGWLPDARLLVAAWPAGCAAGAFDLWVVGRPDPPRPELVAELFVAGVHDAAVRTPVPAPPPPPQENFAGFA